MAGTLENPMSFGTALEGAVGHACKTKGLALMYKKTGKVALILGGASLTSMWLGRDIDVKEASEWVYETLPNEAPYPPLAGFVNIVLTEIYDAPWLEVAKLLAVAMGAGAAIYGVGYYLENKRYTKHTQE